MFQLLHQYLIENSRLHMPGIGTLEFAELPARLDVGEQVLTAPRKILRLSKEDQSPDRHRLMGYLSQSLNISEEQAQSVYYQYIESIRSGLGTRRILYWLNLGAFQKDEAGVVQFVQTTDLDQYLPPVSAELTRQPTPHPLTVGDTETTNTVMQEFFETPRDSRKDYWWVWAIVLLLASAILIYSRYWGAD